MKKLLCRLFGHQFGEWEYITEDSCEQVRTCLRDGYQEEKWFTDHQFAEWKYVNQDACEQARVCTRCRQEQEQISHQVENWDFISHKSCEQKGNCERCGELLTKIEHEWEHIYDPGGELVGEVYTKSGYYRDVYSEPVDYYSCNRCGEKNEITPGNNTNLVLSLFVKVID